MEELSLEAAYKIIAEQTTWMDSEWHKTPKLTSAQVWGCVGLRFSNLLKINHDNAEHLAESHAAGAVCVTIVKVLGVVHIPAALSWKEGEDRPFEFQVGVFSADPMQGVIRIAQWLLGNREGKPVKMENKKAAPILSTVIPLNLFPSSWLERGYRF
ncbi:hypothetical protein ACYPKM_01640 [Pseudomonas aeruginosa]